MIALHLIGNCQIESIEYLIEHMIPDAVVKGFDFSRRETQNAAARRAFRDGARQADIILVHPNGKDFLDHAALKRDFPDKCFVIANLYFRGLHPDSCYLGAIEDRFEQPSLYHSVAVLDAFKRGLSEKKAVVEAFDPDNFMRLGLFEAWDSSLEEMRRYDAASDLPATGLIDGYCREFPGFLTLNHPCLALTALYLAAVFEKIGVAYRQPNLAVLKDPLTRHDVLPVHDVVAEYYGLPYRTTQHWMIEHKGRRFVDRADYVRLCFAAYRKIDAKRLTVHSPLDLQRTLQRNPALAHLV